MNRRAWYLCVLVALLVVLGLITQNGVVLLLALPLIVYLGFGILGAPNAIQVKVERSISSEYAAYKEPVLVRLSLENMGGTLEEVHLEDKVTSSLDTISGQRRKTMTFPAHKSFQIEYQMSAIRGEHIFEGLNLNASDHFGLFPVNQQEKTGDHLLVYPETMRLRHINIRPQRTHGFAGPIPSRKPGTGMDFFGIREYHQGDSLRKINWRVSARYDQTLFSNQFEQESITDIGLILDARAQSDNRNAHDSLFEHSVQAAASLADLFLKEGHRLGMLIYGYSMTRVFPGYGAVQRQRILNALAKAKIGRSFAFENLDKLPTRFFPPNSQLVLVSPMLTADLPGMLRFRSLGYSLLIVSPDPVDFEIHSLGSISGLGDAARLARIERTVLIGRLKRLGIRVANWKTSQPLDMQLYSSLVNQPARRQPVEVLR